MDIFCEIINGEIESKIIYEDEIVVVFLDVNPTHNGHSLVVPKKHYVDIYDIDTDTLMYILNIAKDIGKLIQDRLHCDGISFGQNNGIVQEVKHFHLHVIPHYKNESELSLDEVYELLTKETN